MFKITNSLEQEGLDLISIWRQENLMSSLPSPHPFKSSLFSLLNRSLLSTSTTKTRNHWLTHSQSSQILTRGLNLSYPFGLRRRSSATSLATTAASINYRSPTKAHLASKMVPKLKPKTHFPTEAKTSESLLHNLYTSLSLTPHWQPQCRDL